MTANFEETLISVWLQTLVEDRKTVTLEGVHYPVRPTRRSNLREVDFRFEEQTLREGSSKTRIRIRAGRNWRARERRLCNS
jgi:hypothetical protein